MISQKDFVEIFAATVMEDLRDEFNIYFDYDDNTEAWLERGRKMARKAWPIFKIAQEAANAGSKRS